MPAPSDPLYQVERVPAVDEQIRVLAQRARKHGMFVDYLAALRHALRKLGTEPLEWRDPAYHTRHQGGVVCHAIHRPLVFRYVVFEQESVSCILSVKALPGHLLEADDS